MLRFQATLIGLALAAAGTHSALAQSTTLVSVAPDAALGDGNSRNASISRNGRFIAFATDATNLVKGDTNGKRDVFVYDRQTNDLERVSVTPEGEQADDSSFGTALSDDGRYVAFGSSANNLFPGAQAGAFVKDRVTGAIVCVSVRSDGTFPPPAEQGAACRNISATGRYVAFSARASLVENDDPAVDDIYVHDRDADGNGVFDEAGGIRTVRVSASSSGVPGDDHSNLPDMSPDGRFIVFESMATNLVTGDTNGANDAFIHDRDVDSDVIFDEPGAVLTERVSVGSGGQQATGFPLDFFMWPSLSADGRLVAFHSHLNGLAPDEDDATKPFLRDRLLDETIHIALSPDGLAADEYAAVCEMTDDARFIAFYSWASNILPEDANGSGSDLVVYDRLNRSIKLVNYTASGQQSGSVVSGPGFDFGAVQAIDPSGRFVAFATLANLVNSPSPFQQAYLRDRGPGFLADVDGAGVVDVDDLIALLLNWGACDPPPVACPADLDGSGVVDVDDLIMVILNWG